MNLKDTLLAYGEWLDSQHLIYNGDVKFTAADDPRSLDELGADFIKEWGSDPNKAALFDGQG